jgi:hypothetical protein
MYTGTLIADLLEFVERAEARALANRRVSPHRQHQRARQRKNRQSRRSQKGTDVTILEVSSCVSGNAVMGSDTEAVAVSAATAS